MPDHLHERGWAKKCSWQIIEMHHGKDPLKRVGCPAKTMTAPTDGTSSIDSTGFAA
jgi:hypothetical protein